METQDHGKYPNAFRHRIKNYLCGNNLIDSDSSLCRFKTPVKDFFYPEGSLGPPAPGYLIDVEIGTKNATGEQSKHPFTFFIRDQLMWLVELVESRGLFLYVPVKERLEP